MSIGFSDGSMAEDWGQYYTEGTKAATAPLQATEKPAGEFKLDRAHNVPLIASALTKDGSTVHGMAVDHRVNLAMNFEGKDHDITPFLWAHEQAELGPMSDAIKGGMDAKDAYELAHDKVANPAEAAVRNSYAIKAGLDVDKFNEAYWSHINTQKDIAAQPSDQPRHPDAHTTRYALDPGADDYEDPVSHVKVDTRQLDLPYYREHKELDNISDDYPDKAFKKAHDDAVKWLDSNKGSGKTNEREERRRNSNNFRYKTKEMEYEDEEMKSYDLVDPFSTK